MPGSDSPDPGSGRPFLQRVAPFSGVEGIEHRDFDDLEELRFSHALLNDDAIELLQKLRLKRLWGRGWHSDALVQSLADHLTLEHVTLRLHGQKPVELAALANAPKLRKLTLRYDERMDKPALPNAATRKALQDGGVTVVHKPF